MFTYSHREPEEERRSSERPISNLDMYFVYIMKNKTHSTLYVGFTSNLTKRVFEHREGLSRGFAKKYKLTRLVYYEAGECYDGVLSREKELKKWNRLKKEKNITTFNPHWSDLYDRIDMD